jgi:hypothetical protein
MRKENYTRPCRALCIGRNCPAEWVLRNEGAQEEAPLPPAEPHAAVHIAFINLMQELCECALIFGIQAREGPQPPGPQLQAENAAQGRCLEKRCFRSPCLPVCLRPQCKRQLIRPCLHLTLCHCASLSLCLSVSLKHYLSIHTYIYIYI